MGVVNTTPDSFSDGGEHLEPGVAVAHGISLGAAGALIVDVGGESTRPGSEPVEVETEAARVLPVVAELARRGDVVVSVDTRHAVVAERAIRAGAHLVNDVSGLRDPDMAPLCAAEGVPVVIGHLRGEPRTMQDAPHYDDVVAEVGAHLSSQAGRALAAGVPSVVVDPGIGFGKTVEHNVLLLRALERFGPHPVLVGASRKGFIHHVADAPDPKDRLAGTLAVHVWAAMHGAAIVRAHDVAEHRQALSVLHRLRGV